MDQAGDLAISQVAAEFQCDDFNGTAIEGLQSLQNLFFILNKNESLFWRGIVLRQKV